MQIFYAIWAIFLLTLFSRSMVDLSGKNVYAFTTHEGSGLNGTPGRVQDVEPDALVSSEAWAPLGEGREGLFEDETLKAIAANHGKSLHQIVLRWHIQRGIAIFPMSRNKAHMADNLHLFDFELTDGEMAQIAALDKGRSAFFSHQDPAIVEWFGQMVEERKKQGHHPASEKKAW